MPNNVIFNIVGFPCKFVVYVGPFRRVSGRNNIKRRTTTGKAYPVDSLHTKLNRSFYKTVLHQETQHWWCNILSTLGLRKEGELSRKNGF